MKPKIEVIPWVKFNEPGAKEELEKLCASCNSKVEFLTLVRKNYNLSSIDAKTVADKFFKKEEI